MFPGEKHQAAFKSGPDVTLGAKPLMKTDLANCVLVGVLYYSRKCYESCATLITQNGILDGLSKSSYAVAAKYL